MSRALNLVVILVLFALLVGCATRNPDLAAYASSTGGPFEWLFDTSHDPMLSPNASPAPMPTPQIVQEGDRWTLVYTCKYVQSDALREAVESLVSAEGIMQASPRMNTLLVCDTKERVATLQQLLEALDKPVPQILVETRVVEITLDSDLEFELNYLFTASGVGAFLQKGEINLTTPGSDPNPALGARLNLRPFGVDAGRLDIFLRFLVTKGKARLLSAPNLMVALGEEGSLITGEEVPIQSATVVSGSVSTTTVFKRVGIKLRVTPTQITNDTVKMEVIPEVSAVTGFTAAGSSGVSNPIVAIRSVRTALSVKDGEVLTIGGLLKDEDRNVQRRVPLLADIPVIGVLFTSQRTQKVKTQLVFFLRVRILPEGKVEDVRVHQPGTGIENSLPTTKE